MLFRIKIVFFFVFLFELIFWNHVEPVSCHMSRDRSNLLKLKQNWKYFIYKIITCFSSLKFHSSNYNWCCCRCCRRCGERRRRRLLFFNFLLNQFIFFLTNLFSCSTPFTQEIYFLNYTLAFKFCHLAVSRMTQNSSSHLLRNTSIFVFISIMSQLNMSKRTPISYNCRYVPMFIRTLDCLCIHLNMK